MLQSGGEQKEDIYHHIGRQLRALRKEQRLTQAQVADVIDVSPQQYQKYEEAHSKCNLNYLLELAEHYGVSVNTFFRHVEDPSALLETQVASEAELLARLVKSFVNLPSEEQKLRFVQLAETSVTDSLGAD